ncbi:MAG: hypothetical protein AB7V32_06640, partial [Candidatus Berkiella sp.]
MKDNLLKIDFWQTKLQQTYQQFETGLSNYLPNIVSALAVLIAGWLLAKFAKYLGLKLGHFVFQLLYALERKLKLKSTRDKSKFVDGLGAAIFWIVYIYFIFFAIKILDLPWITRWVTHLFSLLPLIIGCISIIFVGFVVGSIAKQAIYSSFEQKEGKDPYFIAQSVRFGIITLFVIWGVDQIGIDISILTTFISIILAAVFGAAALGFGIGSSTHVANLIASYNIKRNIQV